FGSGRLVGERSASGEAGAEAFPWSEQKRGCCDEYARNSVKTPVTVSLRVPEPWRSAQGWSVPKLRPKGVTDGKRVNIPVPFHIRLRARGDAGASNPSDSGCADARR